MTPTKEQIQAALGEMPPRPNFTDSDQVNMFKIWALLHEDTIRTVLQSALGQRGKE